MIDFNELNKAINLAVNAHNGTTRKGCDVPYIVHPLEALTIASSLTNDTEVLCASVLHDTVEDTEVTIEIIKENFGEQVAKYVAFESENKRKELPESQTWKIRKQEKLDGLKNSTREEQILVLSDKLSNLRAIYRDYNAIGDKLWERFNMKNKSEHSWYYCTISTLLSQLKETIAYKEYCFLLEKIFK